MRTLLWQTEFQTYRKYSHFHVLARLCLNAQRQKDDEVTNARVQLQLPAVNYYQLSLVHRSNALTYAHVPYVCTRGKNIVIMFLDTVGLSTYLPAYVPLFTRPVRTI